ncbi:hypothetical protein [Caballeronia sp. GAOx1]|uniref:hypothetical protein n=1 Tax=Caballeronia sp. GAOx1 TaxID=2921761 RepID=UPI00202830F9|nr:hypothetical protein [Caballeronia sp. GAOx1]
MTDKLTRVVVTIPSLENTDKHSIVQIFTSDFSFVRGGSLGSELLIPPGKDYIARAIGMNGEVVGLPARFKVDVSNEPHFISLDSPRSGRAFLSTNLHSDKIRIDFRVTLEKSYAQDPLPSAGASPIVEFLNIDSISDELQKALSLQQYADGPHRNWFLVFPGPKGVSRQVVIPFDLASGSMNTPVVKWTSARTQGCLLPIFQFDDMDLNTLQSAFRHKHTLLARPIAANIIMSFSDKLAQKKISSPLKYVIAGLMMSPDVASHKEAFNNLTSALLEQFPWLPDALPLRANFLSRIGCHSEARKVLDSLPSSMIPWTRRGMRVLVDRLVFYASSEGSGSMFEGLSKKYQLLLAATHPACIFCTFERRE